LAHVVHLTTTGNCGGGGEALRKSIGCEIDHCLCAGNGDMFKPISPFD